MFVEIEPMNPEIKARWMADLRSGKLKQGQGNLTIIDEDGTEYDCCLGVLCKQAVEAGVIQRKIHPERPDLVRYGSDNTDESTVCDWQTSVLPDAVMKWAGLQWHNPWVKDPNLGGSGHVSLAHTNDSLGATFLRIADLIDESL